MFISDILKSQLATEEKIPKFNVHVSESVVSFRDNRLMLVLALDGMPFESVDDRSIQNRYDQVNRIFASAAKDKGSRLGIWTTLSRRELKLKHDYNFRSTFMKSFADKYLARFNKGRYYFNRYYITLILKYDDLQDGIREIEELGLSFQKSFSAFDPEVLKMYVKNDLLFSEVYSFLGELINGVEEEIPVTSAPACELIESAHLHFGYDVLEIRAESETKFATLYDLKDFPDVSKAKVFNPILMGDMEFTLTQSFICMGTAESQKRIDDQINKMASVGDKADHQIKELKAAKGYISSGEIAFGDYHGALVVYGRTAKEATENGASLTSTFLGQCAARWVKATLSAPATFFSQLPNYSTKPRPMPKATRNLASTFSLHNYSTGKLKGNPIGDGHAIMPLQTRSKSLYSFNFHYSAADKDNRGEKIAGHTLMLGMTGAGKTTTQLALIGFLERYDPKIFALDKDRGMEPFIRGLNGRYFSLKAGEPTKLNPFRLPDTPKNREFLYSLVTTCGRDSSGSVTAEESHQIKLAVDTCYSIPLNQRCFSRVLETIPNTGGNCLAERLSIWCRARDGRFSWALDNDENGFEFEDLATNGRVGFDVTDFLKKGYEPSEPILAYLFHIKKIMQEKGGLLVTIAEEFWLPAQFPTTSAEIFDILKTGRKEDEFIVLVSQSPADAINSPIFEAIREQTPTKIFLPNPVGVYEDYKKCGLTQTEFDAFIKLDLESRTFLIKQGNQSAFAMLDLYGYKDELAILSSSADKAAMLDDIIAEVGSNPDVWMPVYIDHCNGKKFNSTQKEVSNAI